MDIDQTGRCSTRAPMRYRNAFLLGCTALIALTPALSFAQEANSTDATALETLVVEGGSSGSMLNTDNDSKSIVATETTGVGKMPAEILTTPASVSVITAREIEQRGANTIEQVVQYTAGVVTDYYGSDDRYDYFKIRGFSPFTYRDGLAIGRSWGGLLEEPYAFERVEVLKGANSTGFGVSDPGGSVNYVTKLPRSERFGEVYGTGGSFSHKEAGFDFGDNLTEDNTLSYRLTGKFQRSDAEYDYSQDDENFIMGGITWRPTDATSLSFVFDHLDKDGTPSGGGQPRFTDLDRSRFFGEPDYNYNDMNRNTYSIILDHDFENGLSFNASARSSSSDAGFGYAYIWDALGASDPADNMIDRSYFGSDKSTDQFIIDAHILYEANVNDNVESRTLFGVEYNKLDSDNDTYYAAAPQIDWQNPVYSGGPGAFAPYEVKTASQRTKAVYLQEDMTFFDKLTVSVGLRNDWFDLKEEGDNLYTGPFSGASDVSEFSKRVGVSYKITDELATYVSYAESVAPPSAGVEPTVGTQYEMGVKYQPDAFPGLFSASVYDLTMENITTYEAPTYLPATIDKVRHRGLDLEAKVEVTNNINVIAAYGYIDSTIEEPGNVSGYNGKSFAQVPEHMASIWADYTLEGNGKRGDMTFGLGARYIGSYYFDNDNTRKSDGAVVFDAAYTYKIQENTTFQVNATNLFDEKHIANDDGGAYYYNPGRTVMATLRQTW
ncbi:MAG TPA: TonB-dependent siderophore receptor [Pararhizobium sp.]|uniref:TonB-dependent siderophore receptor n=1 Tax=Pararhizobium sp. TaxID=1977563 RepID=UPI002CFB189E|nr:TonB-dependent siderophore receptor [Pararhizobium sp.]HTO31447.1 TonB-dependent siderophore receptor [Pararhizobium sp.]